MQRVVILLKEQEKNLDIFNAESTFLKTFNLRLVEYIVS